ncbi:MAG TPA: PTS sugar transporter subunit IIA [Gammaproteobacteria bacterium]
MKVGLLIITHNRIGDTLLETAVNMLGGVCPIPFEIIPVTTGCNPDQLLQLAKSRLESLDQGRGVIVLTDIYGSTPSNIATRLCGHNDRVVVIAGINLPMLIRLLNYPNLNLTQLADKALSGGQEGILLSCDGVDK